MHSMPFSGPRRVPGPWVEDMHSDRWRFCLSVSVLLHRGSTEWWRWGRGSGVTYMKQFIILHHITSEDVLSAFSFGFGILSGSKMKWWLHAIFKFKIPKFKSYIYWAINFFFLGPKFNSPSPTIQVYRSKNQGASSQIKVLCSASNSTE